MTVDIEKALARANGLAEERFNEIRRLKRENGQQALTLDGLQKRLDRYAYVKASDLTAPAWVTKPRSKRTHVATPVLMLSDLHLDEVVDLDEMDGMNAYDRPIAHARLERIVNGAVDLAKNYVAGVTLQGIVVPLLGDIITGEIHDELARTNTAPVPATIVHWVPALASALRHLADEFGHVHVPTVDGNHDRTYKQTPKKKRAESSNAWIIYNWLADTLRDDSRITFQISTAAEQQIKVYDTTFLLTHGDSFRSAGGVGGLYPSLMKWGLRRHAMYGAVQKPYDVALMGHWHQMLWGQDFVVNGSLKGYDEYAKDGGFGFERPQQGMFFVTPEHGIVQRLPVFASSKAQP